MKKITSKQYYEVTNCTPDFGIANFTLDEVQDFLNSLGYDVIIHEGRAKVQQRQSVWGTGEVEKVGQPYIGIVQDILAVKPGEELPTVLDSPEGKGMRINNVFQRELRQRLLYGK